MRFPDMSRIKSIHMVGIGGSGMSPIAKVLREMGYTVTGSDLKESANTIRLRDLGVDVQMGHDASRVRSADVVVICSAVAKDNVEVVEAQSRGISVQRRADMLAWIMSQSTERIAIAGTHGKTTTTSMIAMIFDQRGLEPTFLIGAERSDILHNAKLGNGRFVIAEADESDGSFLKLKPTQSVITNIEDDHLDFYGTYESVLETFRKYIRQLPSGGRLIACADDPGVAKVLEALPSSVKLITYGLHADAMFRSAQTRFDKMSTTSLIIGPNDKELGELTMRVPGQQNVMNALAAVAVSMEAGLDFVAIQSVLASFTGARRRFQVVGEVGDVMIVDDYAHHPTEIRATLAAARNGWGKERRIVVVFQPHRFTRTFFLKEAFSQAFDDADEVYIADIYAAGEAPIAGLSGETIEKLINTNGHKRAHYIAKKELIADRILDSLQNGDIIVTLGAGDIYTVGKEVFNRLRDKKAI